LPRFPEGTTGPNVVVKVVAPAVQFSAKLVREWEVGGLLAQTIPDLLKEIQLLLGTVVVEVYGRVTHRVDSRSGIRHAARVYAEHRA
jgi:hypothetical protein